MRIETERLIVRDFSPADQTALYEIATDPHVLEYCPDLLERDVTFDKTLSYIETFMQIGENDIATWRCYAIELKESGEVVGCLTFSQAQLLFEHELGWMMKSAHTKKGYASEAASAFFDYICETYNLEYLIVFMDTDNPASYRTAEKAGFRLFEKRTVYDYHYNRYCDDYYYFRRYRKDSLLKEKFYGDKIYTGRHA